MVNIFLDQIAIRAHLPKDKKSSTSEEASWTKTLVHTVNLPDFDHINVSVKMLGSYNDDDYYINSTLAKSSNFSTKDTGITAATTTVSLFPSDNLVISDKQRYCQSGNASENNLISSSFLYPDGSVALKLREQISKQVQLNVKDVNIDYDDVRVRDSIRKLNAKTTSKQA